MGDTNSDEMDTAYDHSTGDWTAVGGFLSRSKHHIEAQCRVDGIRSARALSSSLDARGCVLLLETSTRNLEALIRKENNKSKAISTLKYDAIHTKRPRAAARSDEGCSKADEGATGSSKRYRGVGSAKRASNKNGSKATQRSTIAISASSSAAADSDRTRTSQAARDKFGSTFRQVRSSDAEAKVDAWSAVRLLDASRKGGTLNWISCVNAYTLPIELTHAANDASFFSDIAAVRDPLAALISKVLNSRCQARKYGTVAENSLIESTEDKTHISEIKTKWAAAEAAKDFKKDLREVKFTNNFVMIAIRRAYMRNLILCSMLGNYAHNQTRIACQRTRILLYETTSAPYDFWFQSMLHSCPALVVWCVRDFLVHAILDNFPLREQVDEFIHFESFCVVVADAMRVIREYMEQNAIYHWTPLGKTLRSPPTANVCLCTLPDRECIKMGTWLSDLCIMLDPFKERMLAIQYNKPKIDAIVWLVSTDVRNKAPLVRRKLTEIEIQQPIDINSVLIENDENDEMEDARDLLNGKKFSPQAIAKTMKMLDASTSTKKLVKVKKNEDIMKNANLYITKVQFDALVHVIQICNSCIESVIKMIGISHFGVSENTCDYILGLLVHHRCSTIQKNARLEMLQNIQRMQPHAYNLLQLAAEFIKQSGPTGTFGRIVGFFSVDGTSAQMLAARRKLISLYTNPANEMLDTLVLSSAGSRKATREANVELKKSPSADEREEIIDAIAKNDMKIQLNKQDTERCHQRIKEITAEFEAHPLILGEKTSVSLYFCSICDTVYSNVCESQVNSKFYRYGLCNALVSCVTGKAYCKKTLANHRGACGAEELTEIPLLGVRYTLNGSVYQICTQCCCVMVPNEDCDFVDDMMICHVCSLAITEKAYKVLEQAFVAGLNRRCVFCGYLTTTDNGTYIYPYGRVLCARHHSVYMVAITKFTMDSPDATEESMLASLIRLYKNNQEFKKKRAQPAANRLMKANKMKNRNRKA